MKIIPFVHEGLGNSSYLVDIGSGKGLLVDPDRRVGRYLEAAASNGLEIVAALETHLHADFVSGAYELSHDTNAKVFLSAGAAAAFRHTPLAPTEKIRLNGIEVETIASPGHTPEHLSYAIRFGRGPAMLFSGGSLIVGGSARTDLISPDRTEDLTRAQYRTLTTAFSHLPDDTEVLPTHGGGSFCSVGMGRERTSTLGHERAHNPLLALENEEEFVQWFPSTFPSVPAYFFRLRAINQRGARLHKDIARPPALSIEEFEQAQQAALVIDVRSKEAYSASHIAGSISNPFRDAYAVWLGSVVDADTPLLFVTEGMPVDAVVEESLLVGYERFAGWLRGGIDEWRAAGRPLESREVLDAFAARRAIIEGAVVLDVRERGEFQSGHIEGAMNIPLSEYHAHLNEIPRDRPVVAYCGHGERACTMLSLLERAGFRNMASLDGGIGAWKSAALPVTD